MKSMSRKELEELRKDVDKALIDLAESEKKAALEAAKKAAEAFGYSLDELTGKGSKAGSRGGKSNDGRAKVDPKYRNPADASETWSGRGRAPKWMAEYLAAGGSKEDCAI
ncbi:MAG: H-NS histone family protein [Maritimibacter sp.]